MGRTDGRGKATAKVEGGERRQRWMRLSFERGARSEERVPWFAAKGKGMSTDATVDDGAALSPPSHPVSTRLPTILLQLHPSSGSGRELGVHFK
jgi:hypothetical protein